MWNAKIKQIGRIKNSLEIVVDYSNDQNQELNFSDVYSTTTAQETTWLEELLKTKLQELNELEIFEAALKESEIFKKTSSIDPNTSEIIIS